jgi:hypothetical protein
MSNKQYTGFKYLGPLTGHPVCQPQRARVASGYVYNLNVGDPIKLLTTGYFDLSAAGETLNGVIVGIGPYYDSGWSRMRFGNYLPAATTYTLGDVNGVTTESMVWWVPAAGNLFQAIFDDTTYATRATFLAAIGLNFDHVCDTTTSAPNNLPMIDASSGVTTTAQWRLMDFSKDLISVDYTSAYVPMIVSGNEVGTPPASPLAGI